MDAYAWPSRIYDAALEPMNAPVRQVALGMVPPQPGWVVVDAACGTGAALAEYRNAGCRVIGTDVSPAMLGQARARLGPDADLRQAGDGVLPVEDGSADLVLLSLVLHSIPREDALRLLAESSRALAVGGRILVTDFRAGSLRFPRGFVTRGFAVVAECLAGPAHARNALAYMRAGGLPTLVEQAGLAITSSRPTGGGNIVIAVVDKA